MTHSIFSYVQKVSDYAYYLTYGHELNATQQNLNWALKQNREDILKYLFKDAFKTYSILEFAVKCADFHAARFLFELGTAPGFSTTDSGNILYFYMNCLEENRQPNIELLNFLLDKFADDQAVAPHYLQGALELAIENMVHFKKIYWDVIEILFQRGANIQEKDSAFRTPFMILKHAHTHKVELGEMIRSLQEEITFLNHLVRYLKLEKKYCPDSKSALTLEEFKAHTFNQRARFDKAAISMSFSSIIADAIADFAQEFENPDPSNEEENELKQILEFAQQNCAKEFSNDCIDIELAFIRYHAYFNTLVKEGSFEECFETWQLESILPFVAKYAKPKKTSA
jgi:hypothetical protein